MELYARNAEPENNPEMSNLIGEIPTKTKEQVEKGLKEVKNRGTRRNHYGWENGWRRYFVMKACKNYSQTA